MDLAREIKMEKLIDEVPLSTSFSLNLNRHI